MVKHWPITAFLFLATLNSCRALREDERLEEYEKRGYTWPPKELEYVPNKKEWIERSKHRFHQIELIDQGGGERYQGFMFGVYTSLLGRSFTEYGWGITKAPKAVVDILQKRLHDGLAAENQNIEASQMCLDHGEGQEPLFFDDPKVNREIVDALLPLHEAWSGVDLIPNNSYGLRVYRNESSLLMHVDKTNTHIVSSILHVGHGENDEPWPLVIEDYRGNVNEVFLESGDMLFYESSKLLHGRPRPMNGEYYSSLFSHYYPKDWDYEKISSDNHIRVPAHWFHGIQREEGDTTPKLVGVETTFKEPECEHGWCDLQRSLKWHNVESKYGQVFSGDKQYSTLNNIPSEESFQELFSDKDEL